MFPRFNIAGPCIPGQHYMLPPERRLYDVLELIEGQSYFTLQSGRQTGKTTSAMWLADHLEATGRVRALWIDLETAREQPDVAEAMTAILAAFDRALTWRYPALGRPTSAEIDAMLAKPQGALLAYLTQLAAADPRPLVLLLDEVDGLVGEAFLQRVINGGGRIEREYGLGQRALDLMVEWRGQRHAIEVKIRRGTVTEERALDQVTAYLERLGLPEGWLVMFDLHATTSWDERLTNREVEHRGKRVHVVGC